MKILITLWFAPRLFWISIQTDVRLHSPSSLGLAMDYRSLQVGWGTAAELIVTHANIIDQNTVLPCSLETQPTCKPVY